MIQKISKWLALVGLAIFISSCTPVPEQKLVMLQGQTMGTYYHISVVLNERQQKSEQYTQSALQAEVDKALELVNDQMSTYRDNSELSLFNHSKQAYSVSPATAFVVKSALELFQQSDGAFDVTVGPLVNLWGFGPDKKPLKVPTEELIEARKKWVGSQFLSVVDNTLYKSIPELYVDLSSIAKGYGVDAVAELLTGLNINNYLVDVGGELKAKGVKPGNKQWTLAIEKPIAGQNVQRLIHVGDNAVATSGDYRNYYEFDGIRYSHTIDPHTGKPINHKLVSVTVIHESCMFADGYATAITVLGPEKGLDFAKKHNLAVYLLVKQGDSFIEHYTDEFSPYLLEVSE